MAPSNLFTRLRDRRIVQIVVSYAAAAWVAVEVADQLVDRGIVPEVAYLVLLVWFLGGFAAAGVVGWFHGEKGDQEITRPEIVLLGLIGLTTLVGTGLTVQSHREAESIAAAASAAASLDERRIAVLYFEDRSPDGELAYLADGLTEELIEALTVVEGLDVVSRNGSAGYRDSELPPDSVARLLEARWYVSGAVSHRGDDVRVEVALVDAESGASLPRQTFDRPSEAASELRTGLTDEVSRMLRRLLGEEVRLRERRAATESDAAWVLVQRAERARKDGHALLLDDDWDGANVAWDRADSLLARAEPLAPSWAGPASERARLAYERGRLEDDPRHVDEAMHVALTHVERALALEPRDPAALEVRGSAKYVRWLLALEPDHDAAERLLEEAEQDLRSATTVAPLQANAWNVLGHLYYQLDDILEANLAARRAYEADAFLVAAPDILWRLWSTSYDLENRPQSRQWCEEGLERFPANPRFFECQLWNMTSGASDPEPDAAWALHAEVLARTPEHVRKLTALRMNVLVAGALAGAARREPALADSARSVLARSLGDPTLDPTRELLLSQAFVRTILGDGEDAVELLQRYLTFNPERREGFSEHGHWWWRELRADPEFRRMIGA